MVYNPKRNGWEMPGGRIEPGVKANEAVIREVLEESGCIFEPIAWMRLRDGGIFTGDVSCLSTKAEMERGFFDRLPNILSFPNEEYQKQINWAKSARKNQKPR